MRASRERRLRERGSDRRGSPRFRISLDVRYAEGVSNLLEKTERGRTVDMSGTGVYFEAGRPLSVGHRIQAAIDWPAQLNGAVPLQLIFAGVVVRAVGTAAAVKIERYEFRTRRVSQS